MAESYYANLTKEGLTIETAREKAVAFVYVPAQVVSEYILETRVVQWIIPKSVETESIQVMETITPHSETED